VIFLFTLTFLEEAGIFSYRTIGREERLGYPVATFREFNLFINRMANRKESGECLLTSLKTHQKFSGSGQ